MSRSRGSTLPPGLQPQSESTSLPVGLCDETRTKMSSTHERSNGIFNSLYPVLEELLVTESKTT